MHSVASVQSVMKDSRVWIWKFSLPGLPWRVGKPRCSHVIAWVRKKSIGLLKCHIMWSREWLLCELSKKSQISLQKLGEAILYFIFCLLHLTSVTLWVGLTWNERFYRALWNVISSQHCWENFNKLVSRNPTTIDIHIHPTLNLMKFALLKQHTHINDVRAFERRKTPSLQICSEEWVISQ